MSAARPNFSANTSGAQCDGVPALWLHFPFPAGIPGIVTHTRVAVDALTHALAAAEVDRLEPADLEPRRTAREFRGVFLGPHDEVRRLDVAVQDLSGVARSESGRGLSRHDSELVLVHRSVGLDELGQVSAVAELRHDSLGVFAQLHVASERRHGRTVAERLVDVRLEADLERRDSGSGCAVASGGDPLHGDMLAGDAVDSAVHGAVGSRADLFEEVHGLADRGRLCPDDGVLEEVARVHRRGQRRVETGRLGDAGRVGAALVLGRGGGSSPASLGEANADSRAGLHV